MISYTSHPIRAFLVKGALTCYFRVLRDWARPSLVSWILSAAILVWCFYSLQDQIMALETSARGIFIVLSMLIVVAAVWLLQIVGNVIALSLGMQRRDTPTLVEIKPGVSLRCKDTTDITFDWDTLQAARAFSDVVILVFGATRNLSTPVILERQMLEPNVDGIMRAAERTLAGKPASAAMVWDRP